MNWKDPSLWVISLDRANEEEPFGMNKDRKDGSYHVDREEQRWKRGERGVDQPSEKLERNATFEKIWPLEKKIAIRQGVRYMYSAFPGFTLSLSLHCRRRLH